MTSEEIGILTVVCLIGTVIGSLVQNWLMAKKYSWFMGQIDEYMTKFRRYEEDLGYATDPELRANLLKAWERDLLAMRKLRP